MQILKKQRQIFIDALEIKKKSMFNFSRKDKSPEAVPVRAEGR